MQLRDLLLLIAMLGGAIWGGVIGISLHLIGRHLKKHHPREWKQLGAPDLYTAQGARRSRIAEWIKTRRYQRLDDRRLNKWVPLLQKLPIRLGVVVACLVIAGAVVVTLALRS